MYAFVNPWSDWHVEWAPHESGTCVRDSDLKSRGCSIDNNKGMECGKVVNFIRLRVSKGDKSLVYCALNTHMSFSGDATTRENAIHAAMRETQEAGCDSVVYVGDFNSRLHCGLHGEQSVPYENKGDKTNSMDYLLSMFEKPDGRIILGNASQAYADELSQQLANQTVSCFEKRAKDDGGWLFVGKKTWELEATQSRLKDFGLWEYPANFGPTYKVASKEKVLREAASSPEALAGSSKLSFNCTALAIEELCYRNPTGKGKHNPAWTDRVLLQADPAKAKLEVVEYSSHMMPADFGSDHLPVVAKINVRPLLVHSAV